MKGKTVLFLALVTLLLLGIVIVAPASALDTTIGVEPEEIIDPDLTTFWVEVWVRNVANLATVEFKLGYNTSVLTATKIEYGGIFGDTYFLGINETDDPAGYLHFGIMEWFGEPGFTGDEGRAAKIIFTVDHPVPGTILNLYYTILADTSPIPNPIDHRIIDGFFNQIRGDVNNDGVVDRDDLVRISSAYGSKSGDSNWDEDADIDRYRDGVIDIYDLTACSKNYGRSI